MNDPVLLALGGAAAIGVIYNLSGRGLGLDNSTWLDDSQTRLEKLRGNAHANINLAHVYASWQPLYNPRRFRATHSNSKIVRALTDAYRESPGAQRRGAANIARYNYRIEKGVGPHPRLYSKFG